jgi:dTDP-4-dehydrorhamnose reductase
MRVVITGARGMLGQDLAQKFSTSHDVISLSKGEMDITSENLVRTKMRQIAPDVILHAAAFTRVDDAETNREKSFQINAQGTRNVAVAAAECQASLVYYSTDYVFSGQCSIPYQESDLPDPVNYYGFTKLQGEREIQSLCPAHLIIRTSWLFGSGGKNFVCTIARAAREKIELEVVEDQLGKPTWTSDLAQISLGLLEDGRRGLYHVTNSGQCSWFEFAREIVSELDLPCQVRPVSAERFPRTASRPGYSVLDNTALRRDGYPELRSWREALRMFLGSF